GMTEQADAKEVKDLALKEVRRRPYRSDRFQRWVVSREPDFQTHALFALHGEQVVCDFKTWFARVKVSTGKITQEIGEPLGFQSGDCFADGFAGDEDRQLVTVKSGSLHGARVPGQQFGDNGTVFQLIDFGDGGGEWHQRSLPSGLFQS